MDAVLNWVAAYGYAAIFSLLVLGIVGLPVPDEFLLVFSGYLAYSGRLNLAATFASALAGSVTGITCSYLLGRKVGLPLLHSRLGRYAHVSDAQLGAVHAWFERIGHWALFIGYYIPGVRHFTALVAGTACLEFPAFALYAYSGAAVWVTTFLLIGYHFGERWQSALSAVEHNLKAAGGLGLLILLAYLLYRIARRRRTP